MKPDTRPQVVPAAELMPAAREHPVPHPPHLQEQREWLLVQVATGEPHDVGTHLL
ncbi:MAG TPA: hypothetical protein VMV92_27645 [Streptosporangiaceae bacterium]|nr:hypothetical protein [Streptosporangiaceae bacterium]